MHTYILPSKLSTQRFRGDVFDDYDIEVETTQGKSPNTASVKIAIKEMPSDAVESADAKDFRERAPTPPRFLEGVVSTLREIPASKWFGAPRPVLPDENDDDSGVTTKTVLVYVVGILL
jgi:hypothetical protein